MKEQDWIKVGIIAHSEFGVPADARVVIVPSLRYRVQREGRNIDAMTMELIVDVIELKVWRGPDGSDVGLGYSKSCNVLAVCPLVHT